MSFVNMRAWRTSVRDRVTLQLRAMENVLMYDHNIAYIQPNPMLIFRWLAPYIHFCSLSHTKHFFLFPLVLFVYIHFRRRRLQNSLLCFFRSKFTISHRIVVFFSRKEKCQQQ